VILKEHIIRKNFEGTELKALLWIIFRLISYNKLQRLEATAHLTVKIIMVDNMSHFMAYEKI
jgi:hypothetical protein